MLSPVEEIKSRIDLVEFVQSYVKLDKAGANYKARCPFHAEKTPSFFVSPTRQIWHCFGCSRGGDAFKFVMEIEGYDFPEALRLLAERAGVKLRREDPRIRSERNRLYELAEEAAKVFEQSLSLATPAKTYLKSRGVSDATIGEFRIGFAPESWDFLLKALAKSGFTREEAERAGLAVKSEDGSSWYDRFRSRIIFPIADANGRVVGFSGRIFAVPSETSAKEGARSSSAKATEDAAKYVNTPNTLIYDKSRVLYGFDKAKEEIRKGNAVVLVEGQMDVVLSHQAGVKNTIAVSGTALTPSQLKVLRRLCGTLISSFDTDAAGESATRRSLALAAEFEFERKVAVIPAGKDPADTVQENPALWQETVVQAKPVVEFYFEKAFRTYEPLRAEGKKEISALLLPFIAELTNEIEKAHWIGELARRLGLGEETVWRELRRKKGVSAPASVGEELGVTSQLVTRRALLEERLLALFPLVNEELRSRVQDHEFSFASPQNQELYDALCTGESAAIAVSLREPLEILRFKGEVLAQITRDVEGDFFASIRELEKECVRERLLRLGDEIERREKEGNQAALTPLLQDFRTLSEKLKTLF